jgi:hypothetical protein
MHQFSHASQERVSLDRRPCFEVYIVNATSSREFWSSYAELSYWGKCATKIKTIFAGEPRSSAALLCILSKLRVERRSIHEWVVSVAFISVTFSVEPPVALQGILHGNLGIEFMYTSIITLVGHARIVIDVIALYEKGVFTLNVAYGFAMRVHFLQINGVKNLLFLCLF